MRLDKKTLEELSLSLFSVNMEDYYRRRAKEYDQMYYRNDPRWQKELRQLADTLKEKFKGRRVLEIACGTGYWTQFLSETAQRIVATDVVQEMLEIAKTKQYKCPVSFRKEDAYNLSFKDGSFDGGLANFWFSHVPKNRIDSYLEGFHRVLQSGSRVFMADNVYIPVIGGKLVTREGDENTYKLRRAKDGSEDLVLKNYFSVDELIKIFCRYAKKLSRENVSYGSFFWFVVYDLK